ncbi:hypothetical protein [Sphingobacterium faecium]|uniref:hypothetical protein n=1 Tax=Sphingobacterium faecium TaxID=34087 RepID=UPI00320A0E31
MKFKKIFSVIAGFGTIGLLSSLFAKIQGILFPASMELFGPMILTFSDHIQLLIKLLCVYTSCILGSLLTVFCGGSKNELYIVGGSITAVVGWLWFSAIHPLWFWGLLSVGILPLVLYGRNIYLSLKRRRY